VIAARPANANSPAERMGVAELVGCWQRSLLIDIDHSTDTESEVSWLQGQQSFVDLRQPPARPDFSSVRSELDLTTEHRQWMSGQVGFAGVLVAGGEFFEWRRQFDLQPRHTSPDAATLSYNGDLLIEKGWYESYVEHWYRQPATAGPVWALNLAAQGSDGSDGGTALLLRVGSRFGWARHGAGSVADVEIALGVIIDPPARPANKRARAPRRAQRWIMQRSSLPYRQGRDLRVRLGGQVTTSAANAQGEDVIHSWSVASVEGDPPS
jgi:hypothetical protein